LNGDFKNPQDDPGLQKRLLFAFAVVFLIIIGSQWALKKYAPAPPEEKQPQQSQPQSGPAAGGSQPAASPSVPHGPAASSKPQAASPSAVPAKQAAGESETVVENALYKITFTNRGAQVKSWILKKYNDDSGKPLDLVHQVAAQQYGYPLSFFAYDPGLQAKLNSALYVASATGEQKSPSALSFEYSDGDVTAKKTLRFDDSYVVHVETEVTQHGGYVTAYPTWPAGLGDMEQPFAYATATIDYTVGDKTERVAAKKVSGGATLHAALQWAGPVDQYFAAVFLPDDPASATMVMLHNLIDLPGSTETDPKKIPKVSILGAAVGTMGGKTSARLFAGPKATDVLASVHTTGGDNLENAVDFGFFGVVSRPLFLWLKWTQAHWMSNWGWAIVLLTLIINVTLFPLRISSMKSALKMQKIAPQIKALQEKYKKYKLNDPRRAEQNEELAALYKREGVNPVGGCLPMIIQLPFLYAFYAMLRIAIELRHANWLWVKDLASPDPTHLLPIAIIVTMFLMQRFTPQAGMDPMQQRMMNVMMPVMMGWISWNLSAGLGVYWVISNMLQGVQQMWINNTEFGREIRAHAEERARKKGK
jgi:YidC/Oxa1 family membrane protein insertase